MQATRRARLGCSARFAPSVPRRYHESSTCTGFSSPAGCLSGFGTTRRGMSSAAGCSSWSVMPGCSHYCRSRTPRGSAGNCSPAILPLFRRTSRSRTGFKRRSGVIGRPGRGSYSPHTAATRPRSRSWTRPPLATPSRAAMAHGWPCSTGRRRFLATASAVTTRHSGPRSWEPFTRPTCTCQAGRSANWSRRPRTAAGPRRPQTRSGSSPRWPGACGTDWILGVEARARALVAGPADADELYRQATERLGRTPFRTELARAHLLYGEWLRREGRRVSARQQFAHGP